MLDEIVAFLLGAMAGGGVLSLATALRSRARPTTRAEPDGRAPGQEILREASFNDALAQLNARAEALGLPLRFTGEVLGRPEIGFVGTGPATKAQLTARAQDLLASSGISAQGVRIEALPHRRLVLWLRLRDLSRNAEPSPPEPRQGPSRSRLLRGSS